MNNKAIKRAAADYAIAGLAEGDSVELANEKEKSFRMGAAFGWKDYTDTMERLRNLPKVENWQLSFDRIYLHVLLTTNLVMTSMDALAATSVYRSKLLDRGKSFMAEIKRLMDTDLPLVMGIEDEQMYLIMDYQEQVVARIATLDVDSYGAILAFLDQYRADPQATLKKLDIEKTDNLVLAQQDHRNRQVS